MRYKTGEKVAFMTRKGFPEMGESLWFQETGYVMQVRGGLMGTRYVIRVAKSDNVRIVPERDIFFKIKPKEVRENGGIDKE